MSDAADLELIERTQPDHVARLLNMLHLVNAPLSINRKNITGARAQQTHVHASQARFACGRQRACSICHTAALRTPLHQVESHVSTAAWNAKSNSQTQVLLADMNIFLQADRLARAVVCSKMAAAAQTRHVSAPTSVLVLCAGGLVDQIERAMRWQEGVVSHPEVRTFRVGFRRIQST